MTELAGIETGLSIPSIDITGFLSSTWIWVAFVVVVGVVLIAAAVVLFFLTTYKKKVVFFENISGQGYQPIMRTRARILKLGTAGGGEVMKTLKGGVFLSAYGRKMGKNTYWFAKGSDGYYYNILLGDLDAKQGILDVEPVDRDVRMMSVALDRLSQSTYGKSNSMEKFVFYGSLFFIIVVFFIGMYIMVGRIGTATQPLAQSVELNEKVTENTAQILARLESLVNAMNNYENNNNPTPTPIPDSGGV